MSGASSFCGSKKKFTEIYKASFTIWTQYGKKQEKTDTLK